ncbi:MAG: NAD(P)-dependent dehydrogenase (short-subunit alcohol dehydrogenase family) [Halieaceae bacterium]|jgi:NAD(P)-dependent dehydrogenase (short-subunit alcohol dehydrogenase family)
MTSGFTEKDVSSQAGKTFVITGANTGLGYEAARVLSKNGARVIIACRSEEKANAAIEAITEENGDVDLKYVALDLGDLASVRACADQLVQEDRIDALINNAGIMVPPYELTKDGFESQFGVNHLGPFALTSLLLEKLAEADEPRVINTSSLAHHAGKIDFKDINAERGYKPSRRYAMSKLANLLFSNELQRRLEAADMTTISLACHPGVADTELSRYLPDFLSGTFSLVAGPLFNTAASGAWPTLCAATSPYVQGGEYYGPAKRRETAGPAIKAKSSRRSQDRKLADRLWQISIQMTGVDPGI